MLRNMPASFDDLRDRPRFEPLRAFGSPSPALPFSAWRGRSGQRYVVTVYSPEAVPDCEGAVLLAVTRDAAGERRITRVLALPATATPVAGISPAVTAMAAVADEVHLHLVAGGEAERRRAVADLDAVA